MPRRSRRLTLLSIAGLLLLTLLAFIPVFRCDFINYDDGKIIATNPHVRAGLTEQAMAWAWTAPNLGYLQPVTLTSFMLDSQLFGVPHPGAFHATNLAIHCINVILLYLLLNAATSSHYRSLLVAALFAVHPLQVESVAWVSERKGLLATMFALLAMMTYLRYARAPGPPMRGSRLTLYGATLVLLTLSLLSKPIFVVFPVLLLLADIWPLGRLTRERMVALLLEKLPFGVIIAIVIWCGVALQQELGSEVGASSSPFWTRCAGALLVYARSLWKVIACAHLAVPYVEPHHFPVIQIITSATVLVAITIVAILRFRAAPWLLVSWLAFLALLAPVTGIIPFGGHRFADRYSYVSLICLAVMVVWSLPARLFETHGSRVSVGIGGSLLLCILATLTFRQSRYWRSSLTLFQHTLNVTGDNAMAYTLLGNALLQHDRPGDVSRALEHYQQALRIDPDDPSANREAGVALLKLDRTAEAMAHLRRAIAFNPKTYNGRIALTTLGDALLNEGNLDEAIAQYRMALASDPEFAEAHTSLGRALAQKGQLDEAIFELNTAIEENPENAVAHRYLGTVLLLQGRADLAYGALQTALTLDPNSPEGWCELGDACKTLHDINGAIAAYQRALNLRPNYAAAQKALDSLKSPIP